MVLFRLAREAHDDVRSDGDAGTVLQQVVAHAAELLRRVGALHEPQHAVGTRLHGDVNECEHVGVAQEFDDGGQVVEDVRRVGHPESQHGGLGVTKMGGPNGGRGEDVHGGV